MTLLSLTLLSGCAMNLAELRSARVLRPGEMQITQGNNVVVPTSSVVESANASASRSPASIARRSRCWSPASSVSSAASADRPTA